MAIILTVDQKVAVSVAFVDAYGNEAEVDDDPIWETSDDTVVDVIAASGGMSAEVITTGTTGVAQVSVRADADLGDGVVEIMGLLDVEVVSGQAVAATLTAGTPEPK